MEPVFTWDCFGKARGACAAILANAVLNAGFVMVVIKSRPGLSDKVQRKSIELGVCDKAILYAIAKPDDVPAGIELLSDMSTWHKPEFHLLLGRKGFEEKAIQRLGTIRDVDALESALKDDIVSYVDPVDDLFEFYGNPSELDSLARDLGGRSAPGIASSQ